MLYLHSVILFSANPSTLVDFYKKVFETEPSWTGGTFKGFLVGSGMVYIGPHDKVHGKSTNPERMMFNLASDDVQGEFTRLKNMGAKVITQPYQPGEDKSYWIATFADPDDNYFQVTSKT